ncbi:calcium-binding and coiled-coil domain-containing protein 2 [Lates calcarifer]|uniref:Calcium-binding and coiled-coil domain-containing protein 2 n=1 Tax=Lates calcarifer TaxID=8187 RepID=A0A4W6E1V7_LATCA|nr:calcium-binding and coiled-coil domain-containing protein 2 [Lates calcarifer]
MESPSGTAAETSARTYSQVVFIDIPHSYPPATPVTCCYTLTAGYQPHPRDWVGIFKVGWSTAKDYHTFVWVEPCLDVVGQGSVTRQAVFKEYYLPKDEIEFYQFCYVDNSGQVRGASTPFCFKNPEEQNMESSPEDDLLVITTQEQVEQSMHEKAELQKELDQMRQENENLKSTLQKEQQEAAILKGQNEEKEKEKSELVRELDQIKEQNGNLKSHLQQQQQEMENAKEELVQMKKKVEIQQQSAAEQNKMNQSLSFDGASSPNETHSQEKYNRAVVKINQLKDERKELKERIDVQSDEIVKLHSKFREVERELFKARDSIQLLQVDLQSSEKEKERLSAELQRLQSIAHNVDEVKRENQELRRSLSQQEAPEAFPADDCQTLSSQLQDVQVMLVTEKEESKNAKRRAEYLDRQLMEVREQLESVSSAYDQEQRKSGKLELQLREALETISDKESIIDENEHLMRLVNHEKEELIRENHNLKSDIDGLRRVHDLNIAPLTEPPHMQPDATSQAGNASIGHEQQHQDTSGQADDLYEPIGNIEEPEEEVLVCRHCQESFPGITRNELEQHEQSHRVCPFCTMICDNMEQSVFEDHVYSHEL